MRTPPLIIPTLVAACDITRAHPPEADHELATKIAAGLSEACPLAAPDDEAGRVACGENLARFTLLRDTLAEPFLWGSQAPGQPQELAANYTTRFNPLVWRKMYLSLFMFSGEHRIEQRATQTLLHLPQRFRGMLEIGSYPYPFWHSKGKWESYQYSTELVLVIEDGELIGAMRSSDQDQTRPYVAHEFDGNWTWMTPDGRLMPENSTLYSRLFSATNTAVAELERTFRALEERARRHRCTDCHSPDNAQDMNPLDLLNYPNQAIAGRHRIVAEIEQGRMPPPRGVDNADEREQLLVLARAFEAAADQALALEGESIAHGIAEQR